MAITIYCRWDQCEGVETVEAGLFPDVCKACGKSARWTTDQTRLKERRKYPRDPTHPYKLSEADRAL